MQEQPQQQQQQQQQQRQQQPQQQRQQQQQQKRTKLAQYRVIENPGRSIVGPATSQLAEKRSDGFCSARQLPPDEHVNALGRVDYLWSKDWIELFIRNEKILSPDSEISRNFDFHNCLQFFKFFCIAQRILTFSHISVKFREIFINI